MAKLKHQRLSGATLIEVLIAMVIIMVIFAVAIALYHNIMSSGLSHQKLKAMKQLELLIDEARQPDVKMESSRVIDSISYEFREKNADISNCTILEIKASRNGQSLGSIKTIYPTRHEESQ